MKEIEEYEGLEEEEEEEYEEWSQEKRRASFIKSFAEFKKFKANYKRHYSFACPKCEKTVSTKTDKGYYYFYVQGENEIPDIEGNWDGKRLCSIECVEAVIDTAKYFPEPMDETFENMEEYRKKHGY